MEYVVNIVDKRDVIRRSFVYQSAEEMGEIVISLAMASLPYERIIVFKRVRDGLMNNWGKPNL